MAKKGTVNIHGKEYKTVIMRVNEFRESFKPDDGWAIRTWLVSNEDGRVVIQASICDKDDHVVATGFAEEDRSQGKINKTSALENCETSAIGRALAAFGLGGEEYCSADELLTALDGQGSKPKNTPRESDDSEEEQTSTPSPRFSWKDQMVAKLKLICDKYDEREVRGWFTQFLKHEPLARGELKANNISATFDEWKTIYIHFKKAANEAYDMGFSEE